MALADPLVERPVENYVGNEDAVWWKQISITSGQVATLPLSLIFAIVSACGLDFRPFGA